MELLVVLPTSSQRGRWYGLNNVARLRESRASRDAACVLSWAALEEVNMDFGWRGDPKNGDWRSLMPRERTVDETVQAGSQDSRIPTVRRIRNATSKTEYHQVYQDR